MPTARTASFMLLAGLLLGGSSACGWVPYVPYEDPTLKDGKLPDVAHIMVMSSGEIRLEGRPVSNTFLPLILAEVATAGGEVWYHRSVPVDGVPTLDALASEEAVFRLMADAGVGVRTFADPDYRRVFPGPPRVPGH